MSEDKSKKTRRQWLFNDETGVLSTDEASFNFDKMTAQGNQFLLQYGCKQYLADSLAVQKPIVLTTDEMIERMTARFNNLCNDDFKIVQTESCFYLKDPNVTTTRGQSASLDTIYNGLINDGMTPDEAAAKVLLWTGKTYIAK